MATEPDYSDGPNTWGCGQGNNNFTPPKLLIHHAAKLGSIRLFMIKKSRSLTRTTCIDLAVKFKFYSASWKVTG